MTPELHGDEGKGTNKLSLRSSTGPAGGGSTGTTGTGTDDDEGAGAGASSELSKGLGLLGLEDCEPLMLLLDALLPLELDDAAFRLTLLLLLLPVLPVPLLALRSASSKSPSRSASRRRRRIVIACAVVKLTEYTYCQWRSSVRPLAPEMKSHCPRDQAQPSACSRPDAAAPSTSGSAPLPA